MLRRRAAREAHSFAPGHVTGIFSPARSGRDPRARGSVGAGVVLELGVRAHARFQPGPRQRVVVRSRQSNALPISRTVVERLMGRSEGQLTVDLDHELPIGQGFGMSAAGALAAGIAVGNVLELPPTRALEVAHLADLFGGGGLGGVSAILGGGLEWRRTPGIPPWGSVRHLPFVRSIWVGTLGRPIPSPTLLTDRRFLARVQKCAEDGLARIERTPGVPAFLDASEEFTDALGLAPPALDRRIRSLRAPGIRVAQAMFGRSFFAVAESPARRSALVASLERARVSAVEIRAARAGARLLDRSGGPPLGKAFTR